MDFGVGGPVWHAASPSPRVAIVAALELERRVLDRARRARSSRGTEPGAFGPAVYCSGPGLARAAGAARRAIDAGARALVSFGFAGGLGAGAETGTVALPSRVLGPAGPFEADAPWRARLAAALAPDFLLIEAPLVSVERAVTEVADKGALALSFDAATVDMESAAIAGEAFRAGLPFVVLRVVVDGPDDALPANAESLVTARGRTRLAGLIGFVAAPRQIPALIRLARRSRRARAVLTRLAERLAEPDGPRTPAQSVETSA